MLVLPGEKCEMNVSQKGDTFRVNVSNRLTDDTMLRSTSIHWHGLFQSGSAWADGPVGVSQCPISPGHEFQYEFSVPNQAGTFWYHSHYGTQYCDGLRGPLIVYNPDDPHKLLYDVDDETTVITIGEWYHSPFASVKFLPMGDSTLINGIGRYPGGPKIDLAVINVQYGKRYRFRLISISCEPNYMFSIDKHPMTVIEADGENTRPTIVDTLQIFPGQRYSFVLHAIQPIDNYWIRALPSSGNRNISSGFPDNSNMAILRYLGASPVDPDSQQEKGVRLLQETDLHPLENPQAHGEPYPGGADVNIQLVISVDFVNRRFLVNGATFMPPTVPVLLQILSGAKAAQDLIPSGSLYTLPPNKTVEISVVADDITTPHPLHLHGHSFSVIRSAGNDTKNNYIDPVRRDVVSTGNAGSNVTIRFTTDNAGPWFLHCHIDWHLEAGLAVAFVEDFDEIHQHNPVPDTWRELCPTFNALPASLTSVRRVTPTQTPN